MTLDRLGELALMLRPAGGGIHTVSTGRDAQQHLQRRLYGVATAGAAGVGHTDAPGPRGQAPGTEGAPADRTEGARAAATEGTPDRAIDTAWRKELEKVASARVAILAIPCDTGAGLVRGAAFGPAALRAAVLDLLPDFPQRARRAGIVDVGDVFVVPQLLHDQMLSDGQIAATRAAIYSGISGVTPQLAARLPVSPLSMAEAVVNELLNINNHLKIFVLGGDHSVAWPVVSALAAHRKRPFAIVHPDAHTDLLPERLGVKYCFATWAYHANDLIGRGGRLVQVGVRSSRHSKTHWESRLGVRQFWADEVTARGEGAVIDEIVAHLRAIGADEVYLSNDIDGTDAGAAPATGAPEGGGLTVDFVRTLIARLGNEVSLIGADLVEVAPPIGAPEAAQRTVEVGARYMLDSLAALSHSKELVI